MTDIDTRVDAYLEQQVKDAVDELFEGLECCVCENLAAAVLVIEPCGCRQLLCAPHRQAVARAARFRFTAGIRQQCQACKTEALGIRFEALP